MTIPVFGSGDCVEPQQIVERVAGTGVSGVLVGRGVLRNPWILAQAADLAAGRPPPRRDPRSAGASCSTTSTCCSTSASAKPRASATPRRARIAYATTAHGRERWVINKLRALATWYTKGFDHGSRLRTAINQCESVPALRGLIEQFFSQ